MTALPTGMGRDFTGLTGPKKELEEGDRFSWPEA